MRFLRSRCITRAKKGQLIAALRKRLEAVSPTGKVSSEDEDALQGLEKVGSAMVLHRWCVDEGAPVFRRVLRRSFRSYESSFHWSRRLLGSPLEDPVSFRWPMRMQRLRQLEAGPSGAVGMRLPRCPNRGNFHAWIRAMLESTGRRAPTFLGCVGKCAIDFVWAVAIVHSRLAGP